MIEEDEGAEAEIFCALAIQNAQMFYAWHTTAHSSD
jgi:hypothetical protein